VQDHSPAVAGRRAVVDLANDRNGSEALGQHRRADPGAVPLGHGEAQRGGPEGKRRELRPGPVTQEVSRRHGREHSCRTENRGRLDRRPEVCGGADAESDRQPKHPAVPFRRQLTDQPSRHAADAARGGRQAGVIAVPHEVPGTRHGFLLRAHHDRSRSGVNCGGLSRPAAHGRSEAVRPVPQCAKRPCA
jgi:hypothetical protein